MNSKQAKTIPITALLSYWGYQSDKKKGHDVWYKSPLRERERTASFKVDESQNVWYDHALGRGGNILDLVIACKRCSFSDALQLLIPLKHFSTTSINQQSLFETSQKSTDEKKKEELRTPSKIEIVKVKELQNKALLEYLQERKISLEVAKIYLKEIYFKNNDKHYFALGFSNQTGGYELRNKYFKGCSQKDVSFFEGSETQKLDIWEGWTDFLGYLTAKRILKPSQSVLVLNSTAMSSKGKKIVSEGEFEEIRLFLDNDDTGKQLTQDFLDTFPQSQSMQTHYTNFKDFSDYLQKR